EDSPEWRWITGQSIDEYLAGGWLAAVHPDERKRIAADWLACVAAGTLFGGRQPGRTQNGGYPPSARTARARGRHGRVIPRMGASTDVTGQREADEMRGRLTEQLSAAALRTNRLQQATSMLAKELSVHGVVNVVTEIGQSAIGAGRSAVAIVDAERLRLRILS